MAQTLFDKVWNKHVLTGNEGEPQLLYIDLHLIHEVTSPQAFEGLRPYRKMPKILGYIFLIWVPMSRVSFIW